MVPIDETGLGRWSRLKKARKDRVNKDHVETESHGAGGRGRAAPTTIPVEVSGDYRPWLPPLAVDPSGSLPAASADGDLKIAEGGALSAEETAIAEEMNLPDINTLKEESDFSVFMSDGVPDKLRRLALRKLWASNPFFGLRDGLNDYDEDFRGLSDYVYNAAAMKRFTAPESVPEEEQVAEGTEEHDASEADADQNEADKTEEPETLDDHVDARHKDEVVARDGESLIEDDDLELG